MKYDPKQISHHRMYPKSRFPQWKQCVWNIKTTTLCRHNVWHRLFDVRSPPEVVRYMRQTKFAKRLNDPDEYQWYYILFGCVDINQAIEQVIMEWSPNIPPERLNEPGAAEI